MQVRKMPKVGFAVFFMVAVLGAVLLLISQVPLKGEYYDVVDTHSFSVGEPLTFFWTFEAGVKYRFEVKRLDSMRASHLSVTDGTYLSSTDAEPPVEPPWVWYWSSSEWAIPMTVNVTFWHYGNGQEIDQAFTPTSVEISQSRETTYRLTYLIYVGLPLLIIGAILITITDKDVDSRMGFLGFQYGWARFRTECKIFFVTFSAAFVALFLIHLVYLPYYWANASSQRARPFDLYLPSVWTPAVIFYSILIAIIPVIAFSLLSWLKKGKADEIVIFITMFFLVWIVFWVLFALGPLQFGHTVRLGSSWYSGFAATFFSFVGAVLSVVVFDVYKLVRWTRKRLESKAETVSQGSKRLCVHRISIIQPTICSLIAQLVDRLNGISINN